MILQQFLSLILVKKTPVRLERKLPFKEKYEVELLVMKGVIFMTILVLFAFLVVGRMDPYYNGGLV